MHTLRIDIVSDVVCPWCIIGFKRLEQALSSLEHSISADIHWHPFELNPAMGPEGQNLREHIQEKYGTSEEASITARQTLTQLGQEVGFRFEFYDQMRIYNTRKAHQLLLWAQSKEKQMDLEMALFEAYFTDQLDVSDEKVLIECAAKVGLDPQVAKHIVDDESWADAVAATEQQWLEAGINAVPAIIINQKHLISGAQTSERLVEAIEQIVEAEG